ncbi:MAG: thioredoxin family protein [Kangiellaceae bacterium]|nr:thioredoxin family protein [Kangiellaceae bacterium]
MKNSLFLLTILFVCGHIASLSAAATEIMQGQNEPQKSGKMYFASDDQMGDIDRLLLKAKQNDKLALIIMGANWCHDSQSLARKLFSTELQPVIEANYQLLFVDVGYLSNIREVITRFDQPVIYATPTVLVIDPTSKLQLNADNMHQWRDAAKISLEDSIKYFSEIAKTQKTKLNQIQNQEANNTGKLRSLNNELEAFENRQADRLYRAFAVIGPLLELDDNGGKAKNFRKYWRQVARYRYKLTEDLAELREQVKSLADDGKASSKLKFPEYQLFDWEN